MTKASMAFIFVRRLLIEFLILWNPPVILGTWSGLPFNKSAVAQFRTVPLRVRFFMIGLANMRWVICGNEESDQASTSQRRNPSSRASESMPAVFIMRILHDDGVCDRSAPEALSQISGKRLYRLCFVSITPGAEWRESMA